MITHQPTLVPGMLPGESAFTIHIANPDGSEKEMFNIRVLPVPSVAGVAVDARRLNHLSKEVSRSNGTGSDLDAAILSAGKALATPGPAPEQQSIAPDEVGDLAAVLK